MIGPQPSSMLCSFHVKLPVVAAQCTTTNAQTWREKRLKIGPNFFGIYLKECSKERVREKYSTAKRNFSAKLPTMGWIINHHCTVHIARCMCAPHLPLGYGDFSRRQFRQMTTKTWIGAVVGRVFLEIKNWVALHLNCSSTHLAKKISSPIYYW